MTERPEGTPDSEPVEPGATLDDAARIDDADVDQIEDELEAAEAEDDELEDEDSEGAEGTDADLAEGEESDVATLEDEAPAGVAGAPAAPTAGGRRRAPAPPSVQRAPTQSELAVRVTDNASRYFVLATVVLFTAILAFGMLAGNGGLLTTTPAPTAAPSVSVAPSTSASATPS